MFYNGVRLGDILAFGFGLNDATGNHIAGAPADCIVRRAGAATADAAIASAAAVHLTHANLPTGLYEYVFSVSADTYSVTAGQNYLVYAYASASGLSTVACIGGFRIAAQAVDVVTVGGASASAALSAIAYVAATSAMRAVGVTSANAVSVAAKQALIDYDVPTSADVSAIVSGVAYIAVTSSMRDVGVLSAQAASVVAKQALTDYDVPTSADVSVIVAAGPSGSGVSSAQVSVIIAGALANYDVPTSADVSAIVATEAMTSASASSLFYIAVLSAMRAVGVLSAQAASVVVAQALTDYDVPTSADVSALVSTVGYIANLSALRNVGVLSAQAASVVAAQALADYDVPTSADLSVALSVQLQDRISAGWKIMTLVEPAAPISFASVTPAGALSWLTMLATNRMIQTSAVTRIQNAANTEIASASVAYDGTTFTRGPWVG